MENINPYQLILTTCPNQEEANNLAHTLLENHLAACVSIVPTIQSIYKWEGRIVSDAEVLLFIKTRRECYAAIEEVFLQQHSYEIPELIVLPIETGLPSYLKWLDESVAPRMEN